MMLALLLLGLAFVLVSAIAFGYIVWASGEDTRLGGCIALLVLGAVWPILVLGEIIHELNDTLAVPFDKLTQLGRVVLYGKGNSKLEQLDRMLSK